MAMVMNYHQYPQMNMSFNGESLTTSYPMPTNLNIYNCNYPTDSDDRQVAMLIRLCGSFAGSQYGILGNCATATYPGNINDAFEDLYYSNGGTWDGLSDQHANVVNDLKTNYPVILTGTTGILNASNAHIWVADGYSLLEWEAEVTYIDENGIEQCGCNGYSREMIGMCWGQPNGISNGFYLFNYSFTYEGSESKTYDTYLRALTSIRP